MLLDNNKNVEIESLERDALLLLVVEQKALLVASLPK
jgi:hypothetical protein